MVHTDVWSWTERKYRWRAGILLSVNFVLFCALCVFTHWLHMGTPFDFSLSSYLEPMRFWGPQTQNLYDFIRYPIDVARTPIYGVVVGLLLASIVAVPISVAMIYRLRAAMPFCAAVFIFAHMPWMGITLAGSCILAAVRPFRMSFQFGSALVALLPVLLYLYLATRGATERDVGSISPEQLLLQTGPWLLAILAACVMLAVTIFIARLVNYRPGAVAPVMAVMFATPVVLFIRHIGVDEWSYRVLEAEYGPRSKRFEAVQDASDRILHFVHRGTQRGFAPEAQRAVLMALWSERPEEKEAIKHQLHNRLLLELMSDREAAYNACRNFIADHPYSDYVPYVLFIQARALDTRLDELQFIGENARRELYTDFPHVQSRDVWENLLSAYPDSPLAIAARLRLGQLYLRRGDTARALSVLSPTRTPPTRDTAIMASHVGDLEDVDLEFEAEPYLFETQRLRELIRSNVADMDGAGADHDALQALAAIDPHRQAYRRQLLKLIETYRDTPLYPNLVVRWANDHDDVARRVQLLRQCVERFRGDDAWVAALFHLADAEVQALGAADEAARASGIARLHRITAEYPDTCWASLARQRLQRFEPVGRTDTRPAETP